MRNRTNRLLMITLGTLCVAIIGLIAGIAILGNSAPENDEQSNDVDLVELAQQEVSGLNAADISKAIEIYQGYIDRSDGDTRVELYKKRIRYIMDHDIEKDYDQQVINDYIAIDDYLQTSNSAADVINALYLYKDYGELLEKYTNLLRQREETEGIDSDMETVG